MNRLATWTEAGTSILGEKLADLFLQAAQDIQNGACLRCVLAKVRDGVPNRLVEAIPCAETDVEEHR